MFLLYDVAGSLDFREKNGFYLSILCKQYLFMWNAGIYIMAVWKEETADCSCFPRSIAFSVSDVLSRYIRYDNQGGAYYHVPAVASELAVCEINIGKSAD